jgi:two-component system, OmpR family, sensor histidine kinase CpxA
VHLGDIVGEVCRDAAFEGQGRNCRVKCDIAEDSVVLGNAALLHSAIENVVRNAMRYTHEATEVEIEVSRSSGLNGPEAMVRISDRGPGVPEDSLDKLFRPFYRLDDARNRQTGGVGLGLSITQRAIRLHHGRVKAQNRAGGGLMIEITLPALQQPATDELSEASAVPSLPD